MKITITSHNNEYALDRTAVKLTNDDGTIALYADVGKVASESTFIRFGEFAIHIQFHHVSVQCGTGVFVWNEWEHNDGMSHTDQSCTHIFEVLK
jgi:hypothetical protein